MAATSPNALVKTIETLSVHAVGLGFSGAAIYELISGKTANLATTLGLAAVYLGVQVAPAAAKALTALTGA